MARAGASESLEKATPKPRRRKEMVRRDEVPARLPLERIAHDRLARGPVWIAEVGIEARDRRSRALRQRVGRGDVERRAARP